ncbi:MAG: hypothetical protein SFU25_07060 [Candidatus Caenarcaniphilales bacterium]|nr:hypothetical protein [Candidatus Caenarcaniphilales bacterium]
MKKYRSGFCAILSALCFFNQSAGAFSYGTRLQAPLIHQGIQDQSYLKDSFRSGFTGSSFNNQSKSQYLSFYNQRQVKPQSESISAQNNVLPNTEEIPKTSRTTKLQNNHQEETSEIKEVENTEEERILEKEPEEKPSTQIEKTKREEESSKQVGKTQITSSDKELGPVSFDENSDSDDRATYEGDKIDYDPNTEVFIIDGNANIYLKKQNTKISADRIEYFQQESKLKAYGNVLVTSKDQVTYAKYMEIELENDKVFLEDLQTHQASSSIVAESSTLRSTKSAQLGDYKNGYFQLATPIRFGQAQTGLYGLRSTRFDETLTSNPEVVLADGQSFTLSANKVEYYDDRIQNNLRVFGGKLKFKKFPLTLPAPFLLLTAGDSDVQMFGLIAGNTPRTGAGDFNLGPKLSFVLGDPEKKRSISAAPFYQFSEDGGFGGMLEYNSPRNHALIGYGSSKERGIAEITSRLTKHNTFNYGWNSYLGGGITKQFAQLNDRRSFKIPFLTSFVEGERIALNTDLAYISDSNKLRIQENNTLSDLQRDALDASDNEEKDGFRLQQTLAFATKPIVELGTQNYNAGVRILSSTTARVYTTGDFNAFSSFGPNLKLHLHKFADVEAGYNQLITTGESPFGFDQVIQGENSVYINADWNLAKWLTVGGYMVYSISRGRAVAQQARIIFGPEDFKLQLSYDPIFSSVNLGFSMLFNDKVNFRRFHYQDSKSARKRRF